MTSQTISTSGGAYNITSPVTQLTILASGTLQPSAATYPAAGAIALTNAADAGVITYNFGLIEGGGGSNGPDGTYPHFAGLPGQAGGAGVSFGVSGSIENFATILGGGGGAGGSAPAPANGGAAGAGAVGILLTDGGEISNQGIIGGGQGGTGGGAVDGYGGAGGAGGGGVSLSAGGTVVNQSGSITGGAGGSAVTCTQNSGAGGNGGAGVVAQGASGYVENYAILSGGAGAVGGASTDGGPGRGGIGGDGVSLSGGVGFKNTSSGTLSGGNGGVGGSGLEGNPPGGSGGYGAEINDGRGVNYGRILGGAGGIGGTAMTGGGGGGTGGVGVDITGAGTFSNYGTVSAGDAGAAGAVLGTGVSGNGGSGGDGVILTAGAWVANFGLITAGSGGAGASGSSPIDIGSNGGDGGDGVRISGFGSFTNSGTVSAGFGAAGGSGSVHAGAHGKEGDGVAAAAGGEVTNQAGGMINGYYGVADTGGGYLTVANYGSISGTADSVLFSSSSDLAIVEGGSTFSGEMVGGGGTLEFNGSSGTITGLGGSGAFYGGATGSFESFGTYDVVGGGQWVSSGDASLSSSQTVNVGASSALTEAGGTLSNNGAINLTGGGAIGGYAGAYLVNGGTISGAGFIYGDLGITNQTGALIDATGKMVLNNQNAVGVENYGTIESTGSGSLLIKDSTFTEAGSIVDSAAMALNGVTLDGGSLTVNDGAVLSTTTAVSTIGSGASVTNAGTIQIARHAALGVSGGDIDNSGTIETVGGTIATGVYIVSGAETLSGGGEVLLSGKGYIGGYSPASLYNLDNTITGAGSIYGSLGVTNGAAGVIDATGRMVLNNQNGDGVVNNGLIESSAGGRLYLKNATITGTGEVEAGGQIILTGAAIDGGTVTIAAGGVLTSTGTGGAVALGGATVSNAGVIDGSVGGLTITGAVDNTGTIEADNGALTITGAVTDTGSARIVGSGVLTLGGAMAETVRFAAGSSGELVLDDSAGFTGQISGFSKTSANTIDLTDVSFADYDHEAYSGTTASGTLTLYDSSDDVLASLNFQGNYTRSTFKVTNDGSGGVSISDPTKATASLTQAMASFGASGGGVVSHTPVTALTSAHHLLTPGHAA